MKRNLTFIRILALIALALSAYITWTSVSESAQLAGCGEGSGCDAVLSTKWSSWFGLPVSFAALIVYGAIVVLAFVVTPEKSTAWLLLVFLSFLASASGLWFMGLQTFLIKSYCIYCTIVHLCGIVITVLVLRTMPVQEVQTGKKKKAAPVGVPAKKFFYAGLSGVLAVIVLAVGQMKPGSADTAQVLQNEGAIPSSVPAKTIRLLNGALPVSVGDYPVIGLLEAQRIVAHLFDYTCPACRKLHAELLRAQQTNQSTTALVMIPMPLDAVCNPGVQETSYIHLNACTFAKIGLVIWRIKPEAYLSYDHFMFQGQYPPAPEAARAIADQLIGRDTMEKALADPRLDDLIRTSVNMFYSPSMQQKVLPILISPEKAFYGIPDQAQLTSLFVHH
ncbi:vitamin K epoxide reductase family protein [bacterium]|nr:vitamin K epoxide reductase family protein [bacterium]MCI0601991.1 vitamin K epoxide reductase family protein [bacterium]